MPPRDEHGLDEGGAPSTSLQSPRMEAARGMTLTDPPSGSDDDDAQEDVSQSDGSDAPSDDPSDAL